MNQQQKEEIISRWLDGSLTEEELLKSISQEEFDQYKVILNTVDNWIPEGSDQLPDSLKEILASKKEAKVVSFNRTAWISGVAAAVALILVFSVLFLGPKEQVFYAENENLELTLPDNTTKVVLSPGARLSYKDFDSENREVSIEGRVYFDVMQKGAFEVNYEEGSISVLGTQFEVVYYEGVFEATCFEGIVEVNYKEKRAKAQAKDRVSYARGALTTSKITRAAPGWIGQQIEEFENDHLLKVIRVIESRYKVQADTASINVLRRFTGTIPTNDLEQACRKVFSPLGITYQIQDNRIILSE